jgi:hypothetical protein
MRRYSTFGDEGQLFVRFHSDPGAVIEFYDTMKRSVHLEPEKRLMLALLDDALKCYQKNLAAKSRRGKKLFVEAEQWFWERDGEDVFSFEHVCTALGLSPGYVRRMLDKWNAAARAGGAVKRPGAQPASRARKRLRHAA